MSSSDSILIVTGETVHSDNLAATASYLKLRPVCCRTLDAAGVLASRQQYGMVFCDDVLPDGDFRGVIAETSRSDTCTPVIVVSERDDWNFYLEVMKAGAFDYVMFPAGPGEIERIVCAAIRESGRQVRTAACTAA